MIRSVLVAEMTTCSAVKIEAASEDSLVAAALRFKHRAAKQQNRIMEQPPKAETSVSNRGGCHDAPPGSFDGGCDHSGESRPRFCVAGHIGVVQAGWPPAMLLPPLSTHAQAF